MLTANLKKFIMWDSRSRKLYLKKDWHSEDITVLGGINTRKGRLTRVQKLQAVQHSDKWIEV